MKTHEFGTIIFLGTLTLGKSNSIYGLAKILSAIKKMPRVSHHTSPPGIRKQGIKDPHLALKSQELINKGHPNNIHIPINSTNF